MKQEQKIGFSPTKVLKVYRQFNGGNHYIEIHNVEKNNTGELTIGPGKPLTQAMMRKIVSASYSSRSVDSYFSNKLLDPRIISVEPIKHKRHIMWYEPPKTRKILFRKDMQIKSGYYALPGLLYFLHLNEFRVFALRNAGRRPDLNTRLYYAPLFNTVGDFRFCWGSVKANTDDVLSIDEEIKMWESFLWDSKFSHGHSEHEKALKATKNGKVKFKTRTLQYTGMTIESLFIKYL